MESALLISFATVVVTLIIYNSARKIGDYQQKKADEHVATWWRK